MPRHRAVIVSDDGSSWFLLGDAQEHEPPYEEDEDGEETRQALPHLLDEGWKILSTTPGSGARDDNSYWLVLLQK
ncbi:MAG: hypothetical protein CMJ83_10095 [Planctomycetes bacterium]|nr:hypothetical protein [Planctomycetota bacterium]